MVSIVCRFTTWFNMKERAIPPTISMREASKRLGQHRRYVKGLADGLGIELTPVGKALVITEADLERLQQEIEAKASALELAPSS